ncbi:MAG: glycerophosphodiester phosphodiesterase family protein [Lachnospiraceae bacterium]
MGLLIAILVVLLLYLLAVMPRMLHRPDYAPLMGWHYAHRGLHDNEGAAPENSMAAFRKAVDAGYGIELDVQLTKDRLPVVFHDETLKRVCGAEGNVRDYTYNELQQFTLCKSEERIPLFEDVLKLVDGKVPLIIEIKIHEKADTVCTEADKLIQKYKGVYCIESFHPLAVRWYKKHHPGVVRGQLSSNFNTKERREPFYEAILHYLMYNFICKPDFIAYDHLHKQNISRRICRYVYRALSVAWTIRSEEELVANRNDYDLFIFEGFLPTTKEE